MSYWITRCPYCGRDFVDGECVFCTDYAEDFKPERDEMLDEVEEE